MLSHLRQQLAAITMMVWFATIILVVLVVYAINEIRFMQREMLAQTMLPKADRMERILTNIVDNATYQIGYIAKQISQNGIDREHIHTFLQTFNETEAQAKSAWGRFLWADPNGQVTLSNMEIYQEPKDVSQRAYMAKVHHFPFKLYMDEALIGVDNHEPIIPLAMGVADPRGQFLGAVLGCILLEEVRMRFHEVIQDRSIGYVLFDSEMRQVLADVDTTFFNAEKLAAIREWAIETHEHHQQNKMVSSPWGNYYTLYRRMSKYHFSLVLVIPT